MFKVFQPACLLEYSGRVSSDEEEVNLYEARPVGWARREKGHKPCSHSVAEVGLELLGSPVRLPADVQSISPLCRFPCEATHRPAPSIARGSTSLKQPLD